MAKAVLELPDMPENCSDCDLHAEYYEWADDIGEKWCPICDCKNIPSKGRLPDCPLKLVDVDALERKKPKKVISMETTNKFKNPYWYHPAYGHCPVCGRIYWDKFHVGNYCDSCGQRLEVEHGD